MFATFFTICTVITVSLTVVGRWYLAKGTLKPVYYLAVGTSCIYILLNTVTAIARPEFGAMVLYNLLNIYTIGTSVAGLLRLKREQAEDI